MRQKKGKDAVDRKTPQSRPLNGLQCGPLVLPAASTLDGVLGPSFEVREGRFVAAPALNQLVTLGLDLREVPMGKTARGERKHRNSNENRVGTG